MKEIDQRQLRSDSGEIMRGLDEGETYVVMRNGTPVGELTPLRRHRFVRTEAAMAMFRGPPVDYKLLQRDLDAVASQGCSTCGNRCGRQDREHMDVRPAPHGKADGGPIR